MFLMVSTQQKPTHAQIVSSVRMVCRFLMVSTQQKPTHAQIVSSVRMVCRYIGVLEHESLKNCL